MGGTDKSLVSVGGRPMLAHVVARLAPQVGALAISANGDPARFAAYDLPVLADPIEGQPGPLAGLLGGMIWAERLRPPAGLLVSAAADTPFLPRDLVARLAEVLAGSNAATPVLAASSSGTHPTFGLWPITLADDLRTFLQAGERKAHTFAERCAARTVLFENTALGNGETIDPFYNINTLEDAARADAISARFAAAG